MMTSTPNKIMETVPTLQQIKTLTRQTFESNNIEAAWIIGSYAKGTAENGDDVDILIKRSKNTEVLSADRFICIGEELERALNMRVAVHNIAAFRSKVSALQRIQQTKILIYTSSNPTSQHNSICG